LLLLLAPQNGRMHGTAASTVAIAAVATTMSSRQLLLLLLSLLLLRTLGLENSWVHGATVRSVLEGADIAVRVMCAHQTSLSSRGLLNSRTRRRRKCSTNVF
jgi:hypothetical protein